MEGGPPPNPAGTDAVSGRRTGCQVIRWHWAKNLTVDASLPWSFCLNPFYVLCTCICRCASTSHTSLKTPQDAGENYPVGFLKLDRGFEESESAGVREKPRVLAEAKPWRSAISSRNPRSDMRRKAKEKGESLWRHCAPLAGHCSTSEPSPLSPLTNALQAARDMTFPRTQRHLQTSSRQTLIPAGREWGWG